MSTTAVDFGRDTSCTSSISTGRFVTGARLIAEAAYRRLITPRGMLRGGEAEANYGLDLTQFCGTTNPDSTAASLPARIRAELLEDERILTVDAEVLIVVDGPDTNFEITISCTTKAGPFSLQLLATQVTVDILGITS